MTEPAMVMAEDLLLEQVFLNLVLNALQMMPKGGELRLSARTDDTDVHISIDDTGPGIPEAVRAHLFEPFRRGVEGGGTGLGLFLSNTMVRRCGGTIEVRSQPGQGASFTVSLRRARDRAATEQVDHRGASTTDDGAAQSPSTGKRPGESG
jgi:signal transduction histidine kinase